MKPEHLLFEFFGIHLSVNNFNVGFREELTEFVLYSKDGLDSVVNEKYLATSSDFGGNRIRDHFGGSAGDKCSDR